MYKQVTVVPDDKFISVDGQGLVFDFAAEFHALQWRDDAGHIEFKDKPNEEITSYTAEVAPFIKLWEAERKRLEELHKPKPPTFEEVQLAKLEEINTAYSQVIKYVQAGYPLEEVLSWDVQAVEAQDLFKDPGAEAVFVRQLAKIKGVTVSEMRDRILENSANWRFVAGMLTAQRQIMEEGAWVAKSVDEVEAVKVAFSV